MDVDYKDTKQVNPISVATARIGSFALDRSPCYFENCRERFATRWNSRTSGIYFRHEDGKGQNVAQFILRTEEILRQTKFSEFAMTNAQGVLWVEPAKFWMRCRMRRSLFTILLRTGQKYEGPECYETCLFSDHYIGITREAMMRFLFGFTKYIGPLPHGSSTLESIGWVSLMRDKDCSYVKDNFVLPGPRRKSKTVFDYKKDLWA